MIYYYVILTINFLETVSPQIDLQISIPTSYVLVNSGYIFAAKEKYARSISSSH